MAFRHPPSLLYWMAFGTPILFGLSNALAAWRKTSADSSIVARSALTIAAAIGPFVGMLFAMYLFVLVMNYLETPRKGNRMTVIGGEYDGKTVIVTRRHGLNDHGDVYVRLLDDTIETTISPYQLKKTGLWSHLL